MLMLHWPHIVVNLRILVLIDEELLSSCYHTWQHLTNGRWHQIKRLEKIHFIIFSFYNDYLIWYLEL